MAMDSVRRGAFINLGTRTLGVLLVLVITAITARVGTEVQGAFALFTSIEGVLLALWSGFGIALARRVSHHGERPRALVAATLCACIGLGALAGVALGVLSRLGPEAYRPLWMLALAAPALLVAPNLSGLWLGQGRMGPMARLSLGPPALTLLILGGVAVVGALNLPAVLGAWVGAKVLVGLASLWMMWRGDWWARPDFAALRGEWRFVAAIGLSNLASLLNYRVGLLLVERLVGLSATGVYSIAVVAAELLWFVSGSLTQAAYARIGVPDRAHAAATTLRVVHLGVAALVLVAPLLWLLAWLVVPALLGPAYRASLLPMLLLLPGALVFGAASGFSAYFTNHAGQPRVSAQVATLSLVVNAGLSALLVPRMGLSGAALGASLAYAVSVGVLALRFARHAGLPLGQVFTPGRQLGADLRTLASWRGGA